MTKLSDEIKRQIHERTANTTGIAQSLRERHKNFPLSTDQWRDIAESVVDMGLVLRSTEEVSVDSEPKPIIRKKKPKVAVTPDNVVTDQDTVKSLANSLSKQLDQKVIGMEEEAGVRRAESKRLAKLKAKEESKAAEESEDWIKEEVANAKQPVFKNRGPKKANRKGPRVVRRPQGIKVGLTPEQIEQREIDSWRYEVTSTFLNTLSNSLITRIGNPEQLRHVTSFNGAPAWPNIKNQDGTFGMGTIDGAFIAFECLVDINGDLYIDGEPWLGERNFNPATLRHSVSIPEEIGARRLHSHGFTVWIDRRVGHHPDDLNWYQSTLKANANRFAKYLQAVAWTGKPKDDFFDHVSDRRKLLHLVLDGVVRVNHSASVLGTGLSFKRPRKDDDVHLDVNHNSVAVRGEMGLVDPSVLIGRPATSFINPGNLPIIATTMENMGKHIEVTVGSALKNLGSAIAENGTSIRLRDQQRNFK